MPFSSMGMFISFHCLNTSPQSWLFKRTRMCYFTIAIYSQFIIQHCSSDIQHGYTWAESKVLAGLLHFWRLQRRILFLQLLETSHTSWFVSPSSIFKAVYVCSVTQSCPILYGYIDYNLPGFSAHGILQAGVLGWYNTSYSRGLPNPGIKLSSLTSPALAGCFFTTSATWEAQGQQHSIP